MMSMAPSSPRLPSPPPPAEIQIGPKSPSMGPNAARQAQQIEQTAMDANSNRRIHPGTKAADMAAGPPLIPLHELDSAFQLQEHLAALHYYHTVSNTSPVTRDTAKMLATPPAGTDKTLWLYELCRFLIGQCNSLIVGFLFDTPPCSAATCPEMRASEWQFLCAVHDAPKSCCAIDYCCHTLDWAANVVTNAKIFPSRFVVDSHDKNTALKNLVNVFRRLHRIFAHAWFQHRGVFWSVEGQTGLYVFFKTVCDVYDLLPGENYKLPPEAEGLESLSNSPDDISDELKQQGTAPTLLTRPQSREPDDDNSWGPGRTNTKRHIKSSPSTGSAVGTVPEADEEDGSDVASRMRKMRLSDSGLADEETEANIPVIVEHRMVDQPPLRPSSVIPIPGTSANKAAGAPAPAPEEAKTEQPPAVAGQTVPEPAGQQQPPPSENEPDSQTSGAQEAGGNQTIPIQADKRDETDGANDSVPASDEAVAVAAPEAPSDHAEKQEESTTGEDETPAATVELFKDDVKTTPAVTPLSDDAAVTTEEEAANPTPETEAESEATEPSLAAGPGGDAAAAAAVPDDTSSVGSYEILDKEKEGNKPEGQTPDTTTPAVEEREV